MEIVFFWRILNNSQVYFTKYIQMIITSEQIIAKVSAKKPNGVFLMYFIEKFVFYCKMNSDGQKRYRKLTDRFFILPLLKREVISAPKRFFSLDMLNGELVCAAYNRGKT